MIGLKVKKFLTVYSIMLVVMQLCRGLFLIFNYSYFKDFSWSVFLYGIRFDLSATSYLLLPYLVIFFVPFRINVCWHKAVLSFLFLLALFLCFVSNGIDFFYFPFLAKRSTFDIFELLTAGNDSLRLLPQYLSDYWYGVLLALLVLYVGYRSHKKIVDSVEFTLHKISFFGQLVLLVVVILINVVAMRGGVQLKPITNLDAGAYVPSKYVPLVLNTPFSIIRTSSRKSLKEVEYLKKPEAYFSLTRNFGEGQPTRKNVCIIILESFAKEYIGGLNDYNGYTPFLDSLIEKSYTFTNAYANGRKSVDALPSIISSLPSLMEESYIFSNYSGNNVPSLGSILKPKGYSSAFFHGGANGTMRFDSYCHQAQIDHYFGLDEYPNSEKDYDGHWGIFDEPYLQYTADVLDTLSKPTVSIIFTLSSHHPYTIPEEHKGQFDKGTLKNHESIGYTDFALGQFFKYAKNKDWFNNTIFVLTADHTSLSNRAEYKDLLGPYRIPLIVYDPSKEIGVKDSSYVQQIDIAPMVLDLLNEKVSTRLFGRSPFQSDIGMTYQFANHLYQFQRDSLNFVFDGHELKAVYNKNQDVNQLETFTPYLGHDIKKMKAIIQTYNTTLIHNSFVE